MRFLHSLLPERAHPKASLTTKRRTSQADYQYVRSLFVIAKSLKLPKVVKYAGYMLVKNRPLWVVSKLRGSDIAMPLNLGDYVQYWMYMDGIYDVPLYIFLRNRLQGKVFIDIGANVGNFTLSLFDVAKHIYAIEASEANFSFLNANIVKHKISNITVLHRAVAAKDNETITLYHSIHATASDSMFVPTDHSEKVKTVTLDTFVSKQKLLQLDYIKIDVEGAELEILKGAKNTLTRFKPTLIVEFNSNTATLAGYDLDYLFRTITKFGYKGFTISGRPVTRSNLKQKMNGNLYFVHKSARSEK